MLVSDKATNISRFTIIFFVSLSFIICCVLVLYEIGVPMPTPLNYITHRRVVLYSSNVWITTPERNFGSNQVVFGGIMLPVSAMSISCFIDTG